MNNEYVRHVVVSPTCGNRECPNKSHEGTFSLVQFLHPAANASSRATVQVWLCTPCAETVMAAANQLNSDSKSTRRALRLMQRDLDGIIEGRASLTMERAIQLRDEISVALGGAEVL